MKLCSVLRRKGFPLILTYFIVSILCCLTVPIATGSSSTVTFRVEPNVTSGVPVGGKVAVDVYIDAPAGSAIVGWAIDVKVDPNVLKVGYKEGDFPTKWVLGGTGYFLATWCKWYKWEPGTDFYPGIRWTSTGTIDGTTEWIIGWMDLEKGIGASGSSKKLCTLLFTSKNETAYSPIKIENAFYYTSWNIPNIDKHTPEVISGHYNDPLRVDLVKHSAFPEHHGFYLGKDEDGIMNLYAIVKNVGPAATYSKVIFELSSPKGVPLYYPETPIHLLAPGEMYGFKASARYYAEWTPGEEDLGIWYATARVYFDADGNLATDDWTLSPDNPKTFKFTVKP